MSTVFLVPDDPKYDMVGFDVTTDEQHTEESTLTDSAIEDGSIVSDHIIHGPDTFACTVIVTQSPGPKNFYAEGVEGSPFGIDIFERPGGGAIVKSVLSLSGFRVPRVANRIREMQDRLTALRLAAARMTILTTTREYESMILVRCGLPREEQSIGKGVFQLAFRRLKVVVTQSVNAPQPKEKRGAAEVSKGSQAPTPAIKDFFPGLKLPEFNSGESAAVTLGKFTGIF